MITGDSRNPGDKDADPLIGRTLNGRFSILEPIGLGGMGKVYRAVQAPLERAVALKVLNPNFPASKDPGFQQRFLREAALTSKLRHPNTVTVIDYGQTDDGIYFIVMEYLEGQTLGQWLAQSGPLPWQRALNIAQQVCRSLREAHNLGIVHRDLKPANIMLLNEADQDLVKVLDFGLVKSIAPPAPDAPVSPEITQNGTFLGSPQYMAPEQARNVTDARGDVYSLGVVLYQMLMGRPPFISKDVIELIFSHHKEPPPAFSAVRPDVVVPAELEAVVRQCLEKAPERRFQTMDELLEAMRRANMAAGGNSGVFLRPGGQNTTGPHVTPAFAATPGSDHTLALDISVEVPDTVAKARRRMMLMGALVGGVVVAGVAGLLFLTRGSEPPAPTLSQPASAAPAPTPAPESEPSRTVRFRLLSQPPGAQVYYKGEERGTTPLVLELPKGTEGTTTAEFTFVLGGYQTETVVTGGSGEVVVSQKLEPERRGTVRTASGVRSATSRGVDRGAGGEAAVDDSLASMSAPVMLTPEARAARATSVAEAEPAKVAAPGSLTVPIPTLSQSAPKGNEVLPFSEGMSRPKELQGKDIVYTREAMEAGIAGSMIVKCVITRAGRVENCRILKGLKFMNEAVVEALQSRVYQPITLRGRPVAVEYVFNLRLAPPRSRR